MSLLQQCALFALMLVCALGAPVRVPEMNYAQGRTLALRLNQKARHLYEEIESRTEVAAVNDPPVMIRPEDKCDPESLKTKPETCLSRVVLALKNYSRIFGDSGIFQGQNTKCDKWRSNATDIAEVTEEILKALKEPPELQKPMMMDNWMTEGYLCHDSVDRLYSFSIVTARIFSHLSSLHIIQLRSE